LNLPATHTQNRFFLLKTTKMLPFPSPIEPTVASALLSTTTPLFLPLLQSTYLIDQNSLYFFNFFSDVNQRFRFGCFLRLGVDGEKKSAKEQ
jgi:hypothetical protein